MHLHNNLVTRLQLEFSGSYDCVFKCSSNVVLIADPWPPSPLALSHTWGQASGCSVCTCKLCPSEPPPLAIPQLGLGVHTWGRSLHGLCMWPLGRQASILGRRCGLGGGMWLQVSISPWAYQILCPVWTGHTQRRAREAPPAWPQVVLGRVPQPLTLSSTNQHSAAGPVSLGNGALCSRHNWSPVSHQSDPHQGPEGTGY